ncbi:MAG: ABC transporter substrate-binding protein, partial [Methanomassiliicoccales archaeon]|nr:ABC transporter substrate-binding protein [Methanomassiliicoccales archaeon]
MEIFYNSGNSGRATAAQLLKTSLESLSPGKILITMTGLEWSVYLRMQQERAMPAFWLGWNPDYADPNDYAVPLLLSTGTYAQTIGFSNETIDSLVVQAGTDLNPITRAATLESMSVAAHEQAPYLWLAQSSVLTCMKSWVTGFEFNPLYSNLVYYMLDKSATSINPNTFVMGEISGNPQYFDPAQDYETAGGEVLQNVYETLVFYNGSHVDQFAPVLSTEVPTIANGGISADGLTYTFHLRHNVMFHDGVNTMSAADVKYSMMRELRLNDPHGPAWILGEALIPDYYSYNGGTPGADDITGGIGASVIDAHVWAKDQYTVQFNLTQNDPAFLARLAFNSASVVSLNNTMAHSSNKPFSSAAFTWVNTHPIGTGPYMFQEYQPNQFITMSRWTGYWQTPAKIENILLKQIATDNGRLTALTSTYAGSLVDAAIIPRGVQESLYSYVGSGEIVMTNSSSLGLNFLGMNENINKTGLNPILNNIPSDFFSDVRVRQAFNYAFDFTSYNNQVLKGTGLQPNGAIPKGMFGYVPPPDVPIYEYNLTKARQLLQGSGAVEPSAPRDLQGLPSNGQVTLIWNPPADNGGDPVTGYRVYRSTTSSGTYSLIASLSEL